MYVEYETRYSIGDSLYRLIDMKVVEYKVLNIQVSYNAGGTNHNHEESWSTKYVITKADGTGVRIEISQSKLYEDKYYSTKSEILKTIVNEVMTDI